MMAKGLYEEADAMKAIDHRARASGKPMQETMLEFGNQTAQMRDKFGVNAKQFSKDMMEMAGDAEYFAGTASTELAAMTVYIHKLGMEAKSLKSLIDKWDNFESAAEGASKLAQSFGMNVDAMEMMNEQNPAKRMDMLRQSFFESGKAVEDLTRAEKKLLAEQMGLADVADLEKAMADPSISYDDIQAEADANAEASLTQEQAMSKLADTIDKTFGGGGGKQFKSFGDALTQGFMKGMSKNKEFKAMLKAVRCALYQVYMIGKDIGGVFAEWGPMNDIFKSITEIFTKMDWKAFRKDIKEAFTEFFNLLESDPEAAVTQLGDKIKKAFEDNFDEGKGFSKTWEKLKGAFKRIGNILKGLFLSLLPMAMDGLAELITKITEGLSYMLSGDATKDAGAAFDDMTKNMDPATKKAFEKIKTSWDKNLGPAIDGLVEVAKPHLEKLGSLLMAYIFGSTVLGGLGGGLQTFMAIKGAGMIKDALFGKEVAAQVTKKPGALSKAIDSKYGKAAKEGLKKIPGQLKKAGKGLFKPATMVIEGSLKAGAKVLEKTGVSEFGRASKAMFQQGMTEAADKGLKSTSKAASKSLGKFGDTVTKSAGKMAAKAGGKIAALGVKAIPVVGWAVAIADGAVGMSKQMELLEGQLGDDLDAAAQTAGAGAAGVVEFLTLGLLPQPILTQIAKTTASVTQGIGSFMDVLGLKGVYDMLVANLNLVFKVFAGVGDILVGLFTGDGDKVTRGFGQIFEGVWNFVKSVPGAIVSLLVELPWTILKFLLSAVTFIFIKLPLRIIGAVSTMLANVAIAIKNFFTGFWKEGDANTGKKIKEFFKGVWKSIKDGFFAGVEAVYTFFSELWDGIVCEAKKAFGISSPSSVFADIGTAILNGIWSIISFLPKKFWQLATWAWEKFSGIFSGVGKWASGFLSDIWNGIKALPGKFLQMAKDAWAKVTSIFDKAKELGGDIIDGVMSGLGNVVSKITAPFKKAWKKVKGWFGGSPVDSPKGKGGLLGSGIIDGMMSNLSGMADSVKQPFIDAWEYVKSIFSPTAILEHFTAVFNVIKGLATALFDAVLWPYKTAWNWVAGIFSFPTFNEMWGKIFGAIKGFAQQIFDVLSWPYKKAYEIITRLLSGESLLEIGRGMIDGIMNGLKALPGKIKDVIKDAVGGIGRFLGLASPSKLFASMGGFMSDGMLDGFSGMKDKMVAMFDNVMGTIKGMFDNVLETFGITGAVERIMDAFREPHEVLDALTSEYEWLNYGLERLTYQVDDIARLITEDTVERVLATVDMISEIVDNYNEINNLLSDIDPINLDASINRLGQNMSLSSETITIKNKPINITVNLHASMDAKGIATQLSKKGNAVQLAVASRNGSAVTNNVG